jgi:ureidoglycolate hydrolase
MPRHMLDVRELTAEAFAPYGQVIAPVPALSGARIRGWDQHHRSPASFLGGEAQEFLLHRVDLGKICRNVVVAAALAGQ